MLTVPQEYHTYSAASERRTDLIVRLDPLSWPTGINAHGTAHSLCMPIQWDKSPPHRLYASGEYNRTPLDGRALVNGWAGQVYGYLSSALSDQDGLFAADTVKLSCTRNGGAISVLTICFDPAANEYAVDFDVTIDARRPQRPIIKNGTSATMTSPLCTSPVSAPPTILLRSPSVSGAIPSTGHASARSQTACYSRPPEIASTRAT